MWGCPILPSLSPLSLAALLNPRGCELMEEAHQGGGVKGAVHRWGWGLGPTVLTAGCLDFYKVSEDLCRHTFSLCEEL